MSIHSNIQRKHKEIVYSSLLVRKKTNLAVLIKVPNSDFSFWYCAKLVKIDGKSGGRMTIKYNEKSLFYCFSRVNGLTVKKKTLRSQEIEKAFGKIK